MQVSRTINLFMIVEWRNRNEWLMQEPSLSGSCIISNGEVGDPVTSYRLGFSANGYEHDGSEHLQNSNHRIGIRSNLSILMKNQEASPTHAPLSNFCGSDSNEHNFGTSSLQVCQPSSYNGEVSYFSHMSRINGELKYICKDCQKEFPNYNAFGGHMSFHAKASKMIKKLSGPTNPSQKHKENFSQLHNRAREGAPMPKKYRGEQNLFIMQGSKDRTFFTYR
nr:uncharacterized protein LOC107412604 isoform X2 [Ziziphus jujuba var. spinosa]